MAVVGAYHLAWWGGDGNFDGRGRVGLYLSVDDIEDGEEVALVDSNCGLVPSSVAHQSQLDKAAHETRSFFAANCANGPVSLP